MLCGGFGSVTFLLALFRLPFLHLVPCANAARLPGSEVDMTGNKDGNQSQGFHIRKGPFRGAALPWHRHNDRLCNDHWTWSGVTRFWKVVSQTDSQITWTIERANTKKKESASWSRGKACWRSKIQKGTAVVVVQAVDRFAINIWHQLTAIFEAWITPRVLQLLKVLPPNISVSYHVPALGDLSAKKRSGIFNWEMLGPLTSERCNFEHDVVAPRDGFLWDLAWDLPLNCARAPELWRDFQQASHFLQDPSGLHEFLGAEGAEEPSIEDLTRPIIFGAEEKEGGPRLILRVLSLLTSNETSNP
eukprot:s1836_g19.t1